MSKIKVNTIAPRSGTTVTLGEAGDTIALGACASQTGFGRTGTVNWCTTVKTSPLTAVSGKGYFVNTTGGAITVTLPASPSAGDIVSLKDYANTWATACKAVTLANNSSKINGVCGDATLDTASQSITLVYVDGTKGWQDVQDSTSGVTGTAFITATGGTILTCGDFKTHIFTADADFIVTGGGGPDAVVDYFVGAGGGSGGGNSASGSGSGGGGAGGFRLSNSTVNNIPAPTMSPLASPTNVPVSAQTYPITVGGGGAALPGPRPTYTTGNTGSASTFSTITSAGGGGGSGGNKCIADAGNGGSGGGGGYNGRAPTQGLGNTPPVSPPQGTNGGTGTQGSPYAASGAGGASTAGSPAPGSSTGGAGGGGSYIADAVFGPTAPSYGVASPTPNTRAFAGGGGGSGGLTVSGANTGGAGGFGGGGAGGSNPSPNAGTDGTANTSGGGGGAEGTALSGAGGSGVVIIRYKFQ